MSNFKELFLGLLFVLAGFLTATLLSGCGETVITIKNNSWEEVRKIFVRKKEGNPTTSRVFPQSQPCF